ncbi:MAG: Asp23/Gls24 family envelope stress response protein [Clostridia bacterium]|nr:Asp23/Gls24 family envelope stress response protein [Clostridia bacterium]
MKSKIISEDPDKILILGTSDDMVQRIAENLNLGSIYKKIYIEDVATKEEMEDARKSRFEEGKHVVPVPTFEIKEQFSGYFLDPLRILNIFSKNGEEDISEKSIIRPTFSYLGNYVISERAINSIISYVVERVEGVTKVQKVLTNKYIDGMKLDIDIEIKFGTNIPKLSGKIRNTVVYAVDNATGINIFGININIKGISK